MFTKRLISKIKAQTENPKKQDDSIVSIKVLFTRGSSDQFTISAAEPFNWTENMYVNLRYPILVKFKNYPLYTTCTITILYDTKNDRVVSAQYGSVKISMR